jgi:hypothetical protein
MAITFATNLTEITNSDNDSNWSGTDGPDTYNTHIQGTNSESWLISKNSTETATYTPASALDMSATGTHVYIWFKTDLSNYYTDVRVRLVTSTNNHREYILANQTTKLWDGAWKCFVLNVAAGDVADTGTFNSASVASIDIIVDNSSSGNIRSVTNAWIDAIRYGTGVSVYESTSAEFDFGDIEATLNSETNKTGIIARNPETGILELQGKLTISGNGTDTNFTSDTELLAWVDNSVADNYYGIYFVDSDLDVDINSLTMTSYGTNDNTRPDFDASGTVGTFTMTGSAFLRGGTHDYKSGQTITGTKFNDCQQVDPSTSTFTGNTFSNYSEAATNGALLWPGGTTVQNINFINCDEGVEITQTTSQSFIGMNFDDVSGKYDVHLNNGGTSITIALDSASNGNSYVATGGGTVTFSSSVTLSFKVTDEDGNDVSGAYAYIDDNNSTPFILNTTTDVNGEASVNHTAGAVTGSTWRVRKYGYKPYVATVDIGSSDINLPVTLIADPQQT